VQKRVVSVQEARELAAVFGAQVPYLEMNTRTGAGVGAVFGALMECVDTTRNSRSGAETKTVKLHSGEPAALIPASDKKQSPSPEREPATLQDILAEMRSVKSYVGILEAKLEAQAKLLEAQSKALEAQAEALAGVKARTSDESLTYRIQQLVLGQLQKVGLWGPSSETETETPEKRKGSPRGNPVKQTLFSSPPS